MSPRTAKVLIAEEQPVVRDALRTALDAPPMLEVVAVTDDGWDALRIARASPPDVITVDHRLGAMSGLVVIQMLRRVVPSVHAVVLASDEDPWSLARAMQAGATCYLTKRATIPEVRNAVLAAARGEVVVDSELAARAQPRGQAPHGGLCTLSARELDAVRLVALGCTDAEIAEQLQLSIRGVQAMLLRARRKSGVPRRAALAGWAAEQALL